MDIAHARQDHAAKHVSHGIGVLDDEFPIDFGAPAEWVFEPFPATALDACIVSRFIDIARRFPDRLAIQDRKQAFSYADIAAQAARVREAIVEANLPPGPVAVLLEHDGFYPATVLGVLAAGRTCIPLDADHPAQRNRQIAWCADAGAVISAGGVLATAEALFPPGLPILDLDRLPASPAGSLEAGARPDDVAFIIYTSGSTGSPKGVYQDHRGALHDVLQSVNACHFSHDDRIALVYSPSTIAGLRNTLTALLTGASLYILSPRELGPAGLAGAIRARELTVLRASPTVFRHVVTGLGPDERLDSMRLVVLGGERVYWSDVDIFRRSCPAQARIAVHLGATECWTLHSQWYVDEDLRPHCPTLPVGRSAPDRTVTIIGDDGQPVADGEVGEILVSSRYISLGYWGDPELTAAAFSVDPHDPGIRRYLTGDIARRRPDGLLEYVGRKDQQIKLHGLKIEPGEVEAALKACAGVGDAAVVVRKRTDGTPQALVGYAVLNPDVRGMLPRHLLAVLAQRLPKHLMPAQVFVVDALPLLPNFKVDRVGLETQDLERRARAAPQAHDPLLRDVIGMFEQVVGSSGATPEDNLLTMGGDSLQAVTIALDLERRFSVRIPEDVFAGSETIRDLTRWIAENRVA